MAGPVPLTSLSLAAALASGAVAFLASVEAEPVHSAHDASAGCAACHSAIEEMHPKAPLTCVECHGGNGEARTKAEAHVRTSRPEKDERVADLDQDLAYRRFRNPMDLRVAKETCGGCHGDLVEHLRLSLHGTTAGHLSDGFYEMGIAPRKGSTWSVFPVSAPEGDRGEVRSLAQVPLFREPAARSDLASHFADLPRKECMQCHLWSEGRAVRGRVGFDGDYRGEGCAACHVPYALDGLSSSADPTVPKAEPGHPEHHAMTRAPSTQTCTSCHYGDATIGLNFRGLSQLPPGAPGGPEIPGTTGRLMNRQFYLSDPAIDPPDVHFERGMHCIDCHTQSDVMGDGSLHGQMEHAVEISCSDCHGTFTAESRLRTQRGSPIENLRREGGRILLRSKVTGADHVVPQVVHVLDPARPEYNAKAAQAMTHVHENVECYTCHAGWNANFLGFHFDRNESLSQLDLLSGKRTPGRVTTQEKVFATWKSFYAGLDERGEVAPYLTGFSTMGSVTDAKGARLLDQVMPVTAAGLSGMTMVHHQMHTTRPTARSCVECHRTSQTWGLGSVNFRLARQLAFVADRRGLEVVALNRAQLETSVPLAKAVIPDIVALEILSEPHQGFAQYVFAAEGARGIHVVDVRDPTAPRKVAFVESIDPQGLRLAGEHLYVADGAGGLRVYDVSTPEKIHLVAKVPMFDAKSVFVQWPWAYVADGPGGLAIVDVRAPIAPRLVSSSMQPDEDGAPGNAIEVSTLFQYSRPRSRKAGAEAGEDPAIVRTGSAGGSAAAEAPMDLRAPAHNLCAVLDEERGLLLVDVTEPSSPRQLFPNPPRRAPQGRTEPAREAEPGRFVGLSLASHVDLAQPQGGQRTAERDYAYVLYEKPEGNNRASFLILFDVSDPTRPRRTGVGRVGQSVEMLSLASFYNPPFLQTLLLSPGGDGVFITDATVSAQPVQRGAISGIVGTYVIAVESFPLDKMLDEAGRPLKDVSHAGSRWMVLPEIERILSVKPEALGTQASLVATADDPATTARLSFARQDADGSGFLTDEEMKGCAGADADTDGRVSLAEFAAFAGILGAPKGTAPAAIHEPPGRVDRVDPDGDLARLLDGTDPYPFDRNEDGALDHAEMQRVFFAALDLDGDGKLSFAELSRCPGMRRLRYGDRRARELFAAVDANKSGAIEPPELKLGEEEWAALDADHNGSVRLATRRGSAAYRRAIDAAKSRPEWPSRRRYYAMLPPMLTPERMYATFDKDGDGVLSRTELKKRADLLADMDDDGDGSIGPKELQARLKVIGALGVEATPDAFVPRWDLDGDGKVEEGELPIAPWLRGRILGRGK